MFDPYYIVTSCDIQAGAARRAWLSIRFQDSQSATEVQMIHDLQAIENENREFKRLLKEEVRNG